MCTPYVHSMCTPYRWLIVPRVLCEDVCVSWEWVRLMSASFVLVFFFRCRGSLSICLCARGCRECLFRHSLHWHFKLITVVEILLRSRGSSWKPRAKRFPFSQCYLFHGAMNCSWSKQFLSYLSVSCAPTSSYMYLSIDAVHILSLIELVLRLRNVLS